MLADFSAAINFQPDGPAVAAGYVVDAGTVYAARPDGLTYGWDQDVSKRAKSRPNAAATDARYETFIAPNRAAWNLAVPNGTYTVHVVAGDGKKGTRARVDVEGVRALDAKASKGVRYLDGYVTVDVADGNLTISPGDRYKGNRLNFVEVHPGPAAGQTYDGEPAVNRPGDLSGLQVVTGTGRHAVASPLADGATLDLPSGGVVIQAVTVPPVVGSVVFALDGVPFRTENTAPYSAGGEDAAGDPLPLMLTSGEHTLTATPYAGSDGRGAQGAAATVAFTVTNSPVTAPPVSVAWTAAASPVPTERVEGAVARLGTKLYDFGGYSGDNSASPAPTTCSTPPPACGPPAPSSPAPRPTPPSPATGSGTSTKSPASSAAASPARPSRTRTCSTPRPAPGPTSRMSPRPATPPGSRTSTASSTSSAATARTAPPSATRT
ncbi:MAG TPA: hypothetical protein VF796_02470 [Humisphaera sp.]